MLYSYQLPDIRKAGVSEKTIFLRADLDVLLSDGVIGDDARLVSGLPTIKFLLAHGAKVIVAGHLDRPKGADYEERSRNQELSLRPVTSWLAKMPIIHNSKFMIRETKIGEFDGWEITPNLFLLENLRFYEEEEENDPEFAKKLASLADVYVNDAFAMCHRNHASVVGVARLLPHFAGLRLQQEVDALSNVLDDLPRPLIVIIGGKKVETKLPLVSKMINFADFVLVGGKVAWEIRKESPNLIVAKPNENLDDISEESVQQFKTIIKTAKTIVWNGPVGKIEARGPAADFPPTSAPLVSPSEPNAMRAVGSPSIRVTPRNSESGTREIARTIAESSAYKVVGGGDTTEFLKRVGLLDKFDFVSTGGGAMLAFLSGEKLPGLEVLLR